MKKVRLDFNRVSPLARYFIKDAYVQGNKIYYTDVMSGKKHYIIGEKLT